MGDSQPRPLPSAAVLRKRAVSTFWDEPRDKFKHGLTVAHTALFPNKTVAVCSLYTFVLSQTARRDEEIRRAQEKTRKNLQTFPNSL